VISRCQNSGNYKVRFRAAGGDLYLCNLLIAWFSSKPRLAVWFSEEDFFARLWLYDYMHVLCSM
jgi:hypothetical protein